MNGDRVKNMDGNIYTSFKSHYTTYRREKWAAFMMWTLFVQFEHIFIQPTTM